MISESLSWRLPSGLAADIRERYAKHGGEYVTEELHLDGRRINACMERDSYQDMLEEVVDAVFNVLVILFKYRQQTGHDDLATIDGLLNPLCNIYVVARLRMGKTV